MRLADRLLQAREEERRRIGRELHDDINQKIGLIAIDLDRLCVRAAHDERPGPEELRAVWSRVDALSRDVHLVSRRLQESDAFELSRTLSDLCADIGNRTSLQIATLIDDVDDRVGPAAARALYRIAQEALQNVVRHSGASNVRVRLESAGDEVLLEVSDDGIGFGRAAPRGEGLGVTGMRERMREVKGSLSVIASQGGGAIVRATVRAMK